MAGLITEGKWAGWTEWSDPHPDTFHQFIGPARSQATGASKALVGLETRSMHRNRTDVLHGGFLAAFADHAYFGALSILGHTQHIDGVTVDLSMQYLSAGQVGPDLIAEVEILRETGRLFFMRQLITQAKEPVVASTATIRKALVAK